MDENIEPIVYRARGFLDFVEEASLFGQGFILLLVGLGIYHAILSIRTLLGRGGSSAPGVHALLLLSSPCLVLLFVCANLPTTFPNLFVVGIDADMALKHALEFTSLLGWIALWNFIPNLFLSLAVFKRSALRDAAANASPKAHPSV